jgi:hypothetical protein
MNAIEVAVLFLNPGIKKGRFPGQAGTFDGDDIIH